MKTAAALFLLVIAARGQNPGPSITGANNPPGCASGFSLCRQITLGTITGTLTNWPAYVNLTSSGLGALGAGKINNSSCFDVGFSADQAGTTPLFWELESSLCDNSTGSVAAWVMIPSAATGTTFWVQYKGAQTTFQSTSTAVWNSTYVGVWHMTNGGVMGTADSTINANTLTTPFGATTLQAGEIDGAADFTGGGNILSNGSASFAQTTWTQEQWIFVPTIPTSTQVFVETPNNNYWMAVENTGQIDINIPGLGDACTGLASIGTGWTHVTGTKTGNAYQIFVDGSTASPGNTCTTSTTPVPTAGIDFGAFNSAGPVLGFTGRIDEARVGNVVFTAAWIAADFASQNAPASWATLGPEL